MKALSSGFIVYDMHSKKMLACHASGRPKSTQATYDIPKGHIENGETPYEAAKRELFEETGIDFHKIECNYVIEDLGEYEYTKEKNLHLFMLVIEKFDESIELKCSTYFDLYGKQVPEIDGYEWTNDISLFFKSLQKLFTNIENIDINELF